MGIEIRYKVKGNFLYWIKILLKMLSKNLGGEQLVSNTNHVTAKMLKHALSQIN